jgi:steroid delta-isomerase-like uncharacterized protein
MSLEGTERCIQQYLDALLNGGDFAAFFDADVVWTTMETGDEIRGPEAVRDFIVGLHTEWFQATPEVKHVTVSDGVAGLEAVFVATHVAEFAGVPASNAQVRMPYSVFYDISADKITALRAYFPVSALIAQLQEAASVSA